MPLLFVHLFLPSTDHVSLTSSIYFAVRRQNALTLSSEIIKESNFSDNAFNSAYVSDVQSLITKVVCNNFLANFFKTR